ncbi:GntR family transcriptional regulator [Pseudooceanicola atlanticus]|uniref:GntR family transcriptional regulator n=1 Tax=Pseudooceanicola atlanticus TaxID=1461694 RepID=UPI0012E091D5|nr:GntR family transcriptional regulator [Pseudooceanicola atlanticus]
MYNLDPCVYIRSQTPYLQTGATPLPRASETIRRALESEIHAGQLRPGDRIDEASLAARFDISRTPAREAIMQLAAAGLVQMRPRQGAVVAALGAEEAVAMMETLALLEAEAAGLAAERMTGPELPPLIALHSDSHAAVTGRDSAAYIAMNTRFHELIHAGARNEYLARMIRDTRTRMAFYHASSLTQTARLDRSWQEHGRVVEAIRNGNADAARDAMRDHILSGGRVYADLVAALKAPRPAHLSDE